jgi:hypothetical protein
MKNFIPWPRGNTTYASKEVCEQKEGVPCWGFDPREVNPAALTLQDIEVDDESQPIIEEAEPTDEGCPEGFESHEDTCHKVTGYQKKIVQMLLEDAELSQGLAAKAAAEQEMSDLLRDLAASDWMVVRRAETGVEVPEIVLLAREAARQRISELRLLLAS